MKAKTGSTLSPGSAQDRIRESPGKTDPHRPSGIAKIVSGWEYVSADLTVQELAREILHVESALAIAVVDADRAAVGLVVRRDFQEQLAQLYWRDVHKDDPISKHMIRVPRFDATTHIPSVARRLLGDFTPNRIKYFLVEKNGRFHGTFSSIDLLRHLTEVTQTDIAMASGLQERITPKRIDAGFDGGDAWGASRMAFGVGGDFMQVKPLPGRIFAAICDVSGKGISASLVTAMLAGMLEVHDHAPGGLGPFLDRANRFITRSFDGDRFVTGLFLEWNPVEKWVDIYDHGHSLLYLFRPDGNQARFHQLTSDSTVPPLGVAFERPSRQARFPLRSGDFLLLLTDGITEQIDDQGVEFGIQRVAEVLFRSWKEGAIRDFPEDLLKSLEAYMGNRPQQDDLTLLLLHQR